MADEAIKTAVVERLEQIRDELKRQSKYKPGKPVIVAESLRGVRHAMGYGPDEVSCTKLGDALRSLHNKAKIRCSRPKDRGSDHRPYELYI